MRDKRPTTNHSVDPELARFLLALGAVGELTLAAELAGVDPDRAERWVAGLDRPPWMTRRGEAARRLFAVANEALRQTQQWLEAETPPEGKPVSLRELVMVAERFYAAALKLDKDVGANGEHNFELELDEADDEAAGAVEPSSAPSGTEDRHG